MISCGPQERVSKEVFEDVNRSMEVKKLSEAQILEEAMYWGDSISREAQAQLIGQLEKAIEEKGWADAITFCSLEALPILSDIGGKYGVSIRRVSNKYRNPLNQPNTEELPVLEAYEYNFESGLKSDPNIQKIHGGEVYLYTKAIMISSNLCLSCHGNPDADIAEDTFSKIEALYTDDKAVNFGIGDLRGMWSLRIPKKEVVNRIK